MNLGEWLRVILTESLVKRGLSLAAAAISFFKHSVTFLLFALLASAVFVEDLNERQRSRCIFYECVPLVYLSLWGLCIQSKPAFREKRFFFSCPRCQRQGKLWLCLGFWYAFQTGGKTSQPLRLICNGDFFFYYYYHRCFRKQNSQGCQASDKFVFLWWFQQTWGLFCFVP